MREGEREKKEREICSRLLINVRIFLLLLFVIFKTGTTGQMSRKNLHTIAEKTKKKNSLL